MVFLYTIIIFFAACSYAAVCEQRAARQDLRAGRMGVAAATAQTVGASGVSLHVTNAVAVLAVSFAAHSFPASAAPLLLAKPPLTAALAATWQDERNASYLGEITVEGGDDDRRHLQELPTWAFPAVEGSRIDLAEKEAVVAGTNKLKSASYEGMESVITLVDSGCALSMGNDRRQYLKGSMYMSECNISGSAGAHSVSERGTLVLYVLLEGLEEKHNGIGRMLFKGAPLNENCEFVLMAIGRACRTLGYSFYLPPWGDDGYIGLPNGARVAIQNHDVATMNILAYGTASAESRDEGSAIQGGVSRLARGEPRYAKYNAIRTTEIYFGRSR
jgi:hypothetical protein